MSRPRKSSDTQKSRQISFRLTETEYAQLEAVAERAGLRITELARRVTLKRHHRIVIHTTRRLDPAFIAHLRAVGLNLNQLVHNAHIFGRVSPKVSQLCDEIRRIVLAAAETEERG